MNEHSERRLTMWRGKDINDGTEGILLFDLDLLEALGYDSTANVYEFRSSVFTYSNAVACCFRHESKKHLDPDEEFRGGLWSLYFKHPNAKGGMFNLSASSWDDRHSRPQEWKNFDDSKLAEMTSLMYTLALMRYYEEIHDYG